MGLIHQSHVCFLEPVPVSLDSMSIIPASARVWISSLAMWEISVDFSLSRGYLLFTNDCLEEQEGWRPSMGSVNGAGLAGGD